MVVGSTQESVALCSGLLICVSFHAVMSGSAPRYHHFALGFSAMAFVCYCVTQPYFSTSSPMVFFSVLFYVLVCTGGIAGGVISLLLPKVSTGIILGALLNTMLRTVLADFDGSVYFYNAACLVLIFGGVSLVQSFRVFFFDLTIALAGSLVLAISIGLYSGRAVVAIVVCYMRMESWANGCGSCLVGDNNVFLASWVLAFLLYMAGLAVMGGKFKIWVRSFVSREQPALPKPGGEVPTQQTFNYPDNLEFNFFDPDAMPDVMKVYSDLVFAMVQERSVEFGFQIDNSRNQSEHLVMLLANEVSPADLHNTVAAPQRLHKKMFKNYALWCDRMGVIPLFSTCSTSFLPPANIINDMLIFLLLWGESANLKHMPECMCYLFHKTMEDFFLNRERLKSNGVKQQLYHGYFLDMTVSPMYNTIQAAMKTPGDHKDKKTYDDFNEFFWSPVCLQYHHHIAGGAQSFVGADMSEFSSLLGHVDPSGDVSAKIHVASAMKHATKTYVEKRSWLHSLLSFHRVLEWHLLAFTLSAVWSFRVFLVWSDSYTAQIASVVCMMITFMHIIWTTLEVWRLYPTSSMTSVPNVFGYVLRLLSGYVIFVYQATYYYWSFLEEDADEASLRSIGGPNFWWWQYIWLSMIALSTYAVQSMMCWMPFLTSNMMTSRSDLVQAALNLCYPLSELYVGKKIHVAEKHVIRYIFFWLTLLSFKLWFGYGFIVSPVTKSSVEMYDEYMNFEDVSLYKTIILLVLLWVPHLLVYLIDLSIWFSVWAAITGGFEALIHRQGAVRDISSFQQHFMRLPQAFCHFLMPLTSKYSSRVDLMGKGRGNPSSVSLSGLPEKLADINVDLKHSGYGSVSCEKKKYSPKFGEEGMDHDQNRFGKGSRSSSPSRIRENGLSEGTPLLYQAAKPFTKEDIKQHQDYVYSKVSSVHSDSNTGLDTEFSPTHVASTLTDFLSDRSQRWVLFSKAWNLIIDHLRSHDHLSNAECEIYKFTSCEWFSKPVYLPLCITAGSIDNLFSDVKEATALYRSQPEPSKKMFILEKLRSNVPVTTTEAVMEAWELLNLTLFTLLGPNHAEDLQDIFDKVSDWVKNDYIYDRMAMDTVALISNHTAGVVSILNGVYSKRRANNVVTEEWLQARAAGKATPESAENNSPDKGSQQGMKKSWSYGFLAGLEDQTRIASAGEKAVETAMKSSSSVLCLNEMGAIAASTNDSGSGGKKHQKKKFAQLQPLKYTQELNDVIRDKVRDELRNMLVVLRNAFRAMSDNRNESKPGEPNQNAIRDAKKISNLIANILTDETGFLWDDVYASKQVDAVSNEENMSTVLKKLQGLLKLRSSAVEPASDEAKRRIYFFVNSLFMKMPLPPSIIYSKDFTCVTPYYSEDVLLTPEDLLSKNSDGVSTILYLQTIYANEWKNFLERRNIKDDTHIWNAKHVRETRMWASLRAQTLFRTVEGMMNSEAAVRFLAECEALSTGKANLLAVMKFNYVVACQIYGTMKRNIDHKAEDIEFLLSRHPNLRVAYIDTVRVNRDGDLGYYSVLIKLERDHVLGKTPKVKEIYRVKLPGNPILGEGKPENQNHALIFSRGRYVQAIDMNQDGYFEEALKFRNLLEEFDCGHAILGFREHIFTGEVSSVANYMALQEKSFVTLGQRVLYSPLRIRQHYGHPDFFDKMYVMTQGGMSKASRGINLSEDVYSGFNATIRGESVGFQEYVQVGKGRDVGLQQTYKFEAKLAQGNAEQSLSRDMNRICDRLDFFRLLSFYYGGIGHYMANTMVMCTLFIVVYIMLVLALYHCEGVNGEPITPIGLPELLLAGMGILQTLPLMATLTVEKGVVGMLQEIGYMIISGGPLYFIFHIQTKCYYFQQTLLAGGAMYRPTGRGFVIRHSPFDENFRFFASSHIYSGFEIMIALILVAIYTESTQYFGVTWSLWLIVVSFLFGPFWFNPISFEWNKVLEDYGIWLQWMWERGGRAEQSWHVWFCEETDFMKKISMSWRVTLFFQRCVPLAVVGFALCGVNIFTSSNDRHKVLEVGGLFTGYILCNLILAKMEVYGMYAVRRVLSLVLSTAVFVIAVYLFATHLMYIKLTVAMYYMAAALALFLTLCGVDTSSLYKIHDYVVGHFLFSILLIFAIFQMSTLQTWLLYKNAISSGVAIDDILKYARRSKDDAHQQDPKEESVAAIAELKRQVAAQDALIKDLLAARQQGGAATAPPSQPTGTVLDTVMEVPSPRQLKKNNVSQSSGHVRFKEDRQDIGKSVTGSEDVPVRQAFASTSASGIDTFGSLPPLSAKDVKAVNEASSPMSSHGKPMEKARPQTPPRDADASGTSPRARPLTPHAIIRKSSDPSSPTGAQMGSSSMQEQSWSMSMGISGESALPPNNSFPVRSQAKKATTPRGNGDRPLESLESAGTAFRPSPTAAGGGGGGGSFVFKMPDTMPPRAQQKAPSDASSKN